MIPCCYMSTVVNCEHYKGGPMFNLNSLHLYYTKNIVLAATFIILSEGGKFVLVVLHSHVEYLHINNKMILDS